MCVYSFSPLPFCFLRASTKENTHCPGSLPDETLQFLRCFSFVYPTSKDQHQRLPQLKRLRSFFVVVVASPWPPVFFLTILRRHRVPPLLCTFILLFFFRVFSSFLCHLRFNPKHTPAKRKQRKKEATYSLSCRWWWCTIRDTQTNKCPS